MRTCTDARTYLPTPKRHGLDDAASKFILNLTDNLLKRLQALATLLPAVHIDAPVH